MNNEFDLFIIGGGINGAGIARDAAGRNLKVGLTEKGLIKKITRIVHFTPIYPYPKPQL